MTDATRHKRTKSDPKRHREMDYRERVKEFERRLIRRVLRRHGGNRREAAQALGLTYRELRYQIERLELRERPYKLKDLT